MSVNLSLAIGLVLMLAGWGLARHVAGTGLKGPLLALLQDGLTPVGTYVVTLLATGRPVLAGAVSLGAFGGFAFADHVKRQTLREPIAFTDMSEVIEIFRHPEFYFPFAGIGRVLAGVIAVAIAYATLLVFTAPVFPVSLASTTLVLLAAITLIAGSHVLVKPWAALLKTLRPSGDPIADAARLGPFAMIGTYGIIARAERKNRRAAAPKIGQGFSLARKPPVILVQSESFFDVARLGLGKDFLPAFHAVRQSALGGRMMVPCWGANTTRTEFSVLSGLAQADIGFDIFNPYHAFAKQPVATLASFFRAQGYRTVCIHPFDLRFYGRRHILPLLGFDAVLGETDFPGAEGRRGYVTDAAVTDRVIALLASPQPAFVFVISMENHGPWKTGTALPGALPDLGARAGGLGDYLATVRQADTMIARLTQALEEDGRGGLLGFYGDHMPSLPQAFAALDFSETDTDYLVWRPGMDAQPRLDIAAESLPQLLLQQIMGRGERPPADHCVQPGRMPCT